MPEFTVICAPGFQASPVIDGTRTGTFIIANFAERLAIIGGSAYAGEIKKTIFTVLNYLLPLDGVMPMHCSANVGAGGDVALFFGLSGTGKTTLSADPARHLIGDDEHGWSDNGVFNFEDGCYAKVIRLSPEAEPQIYSCTRRFGTILENVTLDPLTRRLDLNDASVTENTRAAYPLTFIENAVPERMAGQPSNVVFLTCDASGVLPPISRLGSRAGDVPLHLWLHEQDRGHRGGPGHRARDHVQHVLRRTVHGASAARLRRVAPRQDAARQGHLLARQHRMDRRPFGVGKRISIRHTRALLNAALGGKLDGVAYRKDAVFGFDVPQTCEGVPAEILDPASTWPNRQEYHARYDALAARFIANFALYASGCPREVIEAGPRRA